MEWHRHVITSVLSHLVALTVYKSKPGQWTVRSSRKGMHQCLPPQAKEFHQDFLLQSYRLCCTMLHRSEHLQIKGSYNFISIHLISIRLNGFGNSPAPPRLNPLIFHLVSLQYFCKASRLSACIILSFFPLLFYSQIRLYIPVLPCGRSVCCIRELSSLS